MAGLGLGRRMPLKEPGSETIRIEDLEQAGGAGGNIVSGGFAPYFRYAVGPHLCRGLYKDRGYSGLWADDGWRSWETGGDTRQQLGRGRSHLVKTVQELCGSRTGRKHRRY